MKKITSILLTLCLIIGSFNMCALAAGYGDSYGSVEDDLPDIIEREFDPEYAVAYNDFENVTGYSGESGYAITDTGNSAYGKALMVPQKQFGPFLEHSLFNSTYIWNDKTHKVFYETIVPGENYIFSYEYYSVPSVSASPYNGVAAFSLSPQHDDLWDGEKVTDDFWSGNDHRNYAQYYNDNKWHLDTFAFTAGASTYTYENNNSIHTFTGRPEYIWNKLNTCKSNVQSYIDNYLIMKAGEIVINDDSGSVTAELIEGDFLAANDPKAYNKKTTAPLGSDVKFKLNSSNIGIYVSEVKMGEEVLTPDNDGIYSVKLIDDIIVSVEVNTSLVTDEYPVDANNNIYFKDKLTAVNFTDTLGAPYTLIVPTRGGQKIENDIWLSANDKLSYAVGNAYYNAKYIGDIAEGGDGEWTVSDVTSLIFNILGTETTDLSTIALDLNESGRVTVSDVISLRSKILGLDDVLSADAEVTTQMDAFIDDIITRSNTGVTEQDLNNGIYNYGDRTRIANVIRKAMRGEDIQIVYFGGSITAVSGGSEQLSDFNNPRYGNTETPDFTTEITKDSDKGGYVEWITKWFKTHFPNITVNAFNAGIGSTDSVHAVHRMVEDVLEKNPDLVVNEWACNDGAEFNYKQGTYEAVLRRLYDNDIAVLLYGFCGRVGNTSQELHKQVADFYNAPFVSYKDSLFSNPHFKFFTNDATHPNMVGHALAGATMTNFLQNVYENLEDIGTEPLAIPTDYFHPEAHYYDGAHVATIKDIYDGKYEGVRIKDMGSFEFEDSMTSFACRRYYGATAKYKESYEPMVIEIDACKTLFIVNKVSTGFNDGAYYIEVNGEKMENQEFNCSKGKKADQNPESGYHWATPRIMYDPDSPKVELKIYPNITENDPDGNNRVTIYSLLLS